MFIYIFIYLHIIYLMMLSVHWNLWHGIMGWSVNNDWYGYG